MPTIVVPEVERSSRVSHPTQIPLRARFYQIPEIPSIPRCAPHVRPKDGKTKLTTRPLPTFDLSYCLLSGPVSNCGEVCSYLLMRGDKGLAFLSAETGLLFLIDDLTEPLV